MANTNWKQPSKAGQRDRQAKTADKKTSKRAKRLESAFSCNSIARAAMPRSALRCPALRCLRVRQMDKKSLKREGEEKLAALAAEARESEQQMVAAMESEVQKVLAEKEAEYVTQRLCSRLAKASRKPYVCGVSSRMFWNTEVPLS